MIVGGISHRDGDASLPEGADLVQDGSGDFVFVLDEVGYIARLLHGGNGPLVLIV